MKENKGPIKKKNNGNVRSNNLGTGLYSHKIQHAILNGRNSTPDIDYNSLSSEDKEKWNAIYEALSEKEKKEWELAYIENLGKDADTGQIIQATNPLCFYNMVADQVKFSDLHITVLTVLEEMYNQQSVDNTYNWKKGKNGVNYDEMGYVYTNPYQIAQYIWGYANQKNIRQVGDVLEDLFKKKVYLSRVEKQEKKSGKKGEIKEVYRVKELNLLITLDMTLNTDSIGRIQRIFTRVQLHPVFFENIGTNNIRHRNNLYLSLRDYNNNNIKPDSKQKYKIPPAEYIYMSFYLSKFTRMKRFSLTLDEETVAKDINIKEFKYKNLSRGRKKIKDALNALQNAGMIMKWSDTTGRHEQRQYQIELNKEFFGHKKEMDSEKVE